MMEMMDLRHYRGHLDLQDLLRAMPGWFLRSGAGMRGRVKSFVDLQQILKAIVGRLQKKS